MRIPATAAAVATLAALSLAGPALALTKREAVWGAAQAMPRAVGLPGAAEMRYERVRLRGHHARFHAYVVDYGTMRTADADVYVTEARSGALHFHFKRVDVEALPSPDPAPSG